MRHPESFGEPQARISKLLVGVAHATAYRGGLIQVTKHLLSTSRSEVLYKLIVLPEDTSQQGWIRGLDRLDLLPRASLKQETQYLSLRYRSLF